MLNWNLYIDEQESWYKKAKYAKRKVRDLFRRDTIITVLKDYFANNSQYYNTRVGHMFGHKPLPAVMVGKNEITIWARKPNERDDLVELTMLALIDVKFEELVRAGVEIKKIESEAPKVKLLKSVSKYLQFKPFDVYAQTIKLNYGK